MSLLFGGQSSSGDIAKKATLTIGGAVSYFWWMKPHLTNTFNRSVLIHGTSSSNYKLWRSSVYIGNGSTTMQFLIPTTTDGAWNWTSATTLDVWASWGLAYDYATPTVAPKVYKNGADDSAIFVQNPSGTINADGQDFLVGNYNNRDQTFNGRIAHVAMWNRKLTAAEFSLVHAKGPYAVPSGLVAYYRTLESGSAERDNATGAQTNNLTLTGAAFDSDNPTIAALLPNQVKPLRRWNAGQSWPSIRPRRMSDSLSFARNGWLGRRTPATVVSSTDMLPISTYIQLASLGMLPIDWSGVVALASREGLPFAFSGILGSHDSLPMDWLGQLATHDGLPFDVLHGGVVLDSLPWANYAGIATRDHAPIDWSGQITLATRDRLPFTTFVDLATLFGLPINVAGQDPDALALIWRVLTRLGTDGSGDPLVLSWNVVATPGQNQSPLRLQWAVVQGQGALRLRWRVLGGGNMRTAFGQNPQGPVTKVTLS